jgi:hypothetical protein
VVDAIATRQRLSIWHLMGWSACAAALLAILRADPAVRQGLVRGQSWNLAIACAYVAYVSFCWLGLVQILNTYVRGRSEGDLEPGTWILGALAVVHIYGLLLILGPLSEYLSNRSGLLVMAPALAWAFPLISRRLANRWKLLFVGMLVVPLVTLVHHVYIEGYRGEAVGQPLLMNAATWIRAGITFTLTVALVGYDARQGIRYGWFHGGGLVCLWIHTIVPAVARLLWG